MIIFCRFVNSLVVKLVNHLKDVHQSDLLKLTGPASLHASDTGGEPLAYTGKPPPPCCRWGKARAAAGHLLHVLSSPWSAHAGGVGVWIDEQEAARGHDVALRECFLGGAGTAAATCAPFPRHWSDDNI